jgi:cell division protein ZapA (FtsZ GTPase activity inhibitor)
MLTPGQEHQQTKHRVVIAGCAYHLVSNQPDVVIQAAADRVDAMIHEVMTQTGCYDMAKVAVLVALRLAQQQDADQHKLLSLITDHIDQVVV